MFDAAVTRFSYALDENSKTMLAEIELPNTNLELRPGMYAAVTIAIERKENALLLPVDAVLLERAGASVFTVADNKAKKTRIQSGFNDGTNVEVVDGINPDQPVILIGKRPLADGQSVRITEAK